MVLVRYIVNVMAPSMVIIFTFVSFTLVKKLLNVLNQHSLKDEAYCSFFQ
jgi:hypothetical protein